MTPRTGGGVILSNSLSYKHEKTRLNSFVGFPRSTLDVKQLAAVGFFYTKCGDIVRCVFCGVEVGEWEEGDNPIEEHRKWSRNCKFLQHEDVGNIPIDAADPSPPMHLPDFKMCARPDAKKTDHCPTFSLENIQSPERFDPIFPSFSSLKSRLLSFSNWPSTANLKPSALAEAGFFYTGFGDKTVCFHCGGGLKLWKESDNPWEEHALFFSKCSFVLLEKGQEFVSKVLGTKPPTLGPEEIQNLAVALSSHPNLSQSSSTCR